MNQKEKFIQFCKVIKRDGIDKLLEWLEKSDFYRAPASTRFHGNYEGGLLDHSLNVFEELVRLCDIYKVEASLETLTIIALFHDVCKTNFYKQEKKNIKNPNTGIWEEKLIWKIDEKIPLGHGEKSCMILQWFIKLSIEELLAIRWHMGGFDSAVKGGDYGLSKAQDASKLVTLLQAADLISSNLLEEKVED